MHVEVDGEVVTDLDQPVLMVSVGNGANVGGGTELTPEADPEDGKVDVMISHAVGAAGQARLRPVAAPRGAPPPRRRAVPPRPAGDDLRRRVLHLRRRRDLAAPSGSAAGGSSRRRTRSSCLASSRPRGTSGLRGLAQIEQAHDRAREVVTARRIPVTGPDRGDRGLDGSTDGPATTTRVARPRHRPGGAVEGVIPRQDYEALRAAGAAAIFGPGTVIADAALDLLAVLAGRLGHDSTDSARSAAPWTRVRTSRRSMTWTPSAAGCEDCLRIGASWVHLRLCRECGHMGCCDSSPNKHATAHYHATSHPIVQSAKTARTGCGVTRTRSRSSWDDGFARPADEADQGAVRRRTGSRADPGRIAVLDRPGDHAGRVQQTGRPEAGPGTAGRAQSTGRPGSTADRGQRSHRSRERDPGRYLRRLRASANRRSSSALGSAG